jgi:hypothetical protein
MSAHTFLAATQMIGSVLRFTPSAEQTPKLIAPRMLALLVEVQILDHEFAHLSLDPDIAAKARAIAQADRKTDR